MAVRAVPVFLRAASVLSAPYTNGRLVKFNKVHSNSIKQIILLIIGRVFTSIQCSGVISCPLSPLRGSLHPLVSPVPPTLGPCYREAQPQRDLLMSAREISTFTEISALSVHLQYPALSPCHGERQCRI